MSCPRPSCSTPTASGPRDARASPSSTPSPMEGRGAEAGRRASASTGRASGAATVAGRSRPTRASSSSFCSPGRRRRPWWRPPKPTRCRCGNPSKAATLSRSGDTAYPLATTPSPSRFRIENGRRLRRVVRRPGERRARARARSGRLCRECACPALGRDFGRERAGRRCRVLRQREHGALVSSITADRPRFREPARDATLRRGCPETPAGPAARCARRAPCRARSPAARCRRTPRSQRVRPSRGCARSGDGRRS